MSKLENLEGIVWDRPPLILHTSAAYHYASQNHHFYWVTWCGDEPVGLSQFEFTDVISGIYEIKIVHEQGETITPLESDEWVLVFQQQS